MKKIVIFGTGEVAELAYFYMKNDDLCDFDVVAFCCDPQFIDKPEFQKLPVVSFHEVEKTYPSSEYSMHVALSYNKLNLIRKNKYYEAKEKGYELVSYVSSKSVVSSDLNIGDNCLILENQTIQPKVKIGNNVMIWSGNHLGHGCKIKDHTYLSSHICISGYTEIGERCFIGVNSSFKDYIQVGDEVFITMGSSVTTDVEDKAVILGPQSTVLTSDKKLAKKIRSKYFNLE